ncbi:RNA 2',3'-cyclic phosphodiesterase [Sulfurovum sp. TSL6]|uniref:RNA 2',3'-cyclic phosphodiesterase n=1 Tax=Sulfurovum sp. TSL6 TaxID=2826995 RepID=UPI001CC3CC86|nr:RNA 2',3'-cyclic phosphodiesterase [Sulfurovum sp. TSL6]GIU01353.1 RNA 2',3'-cyclic phosphodiesterase [Sulfurovum sp. TSL6]
MRLFIASPVILEDYASIQEDFKGIIEGKWVEEQNLHLTWVFLGDVEEVKPILDKLQGISALEHQVPIQALGYFGRPPRVFFSKSKAIELYNKAKEFKHAGFDLYRFKPHITFCRIKAIHDYKAYKEKLKTYRERSLGVILPEITIYESTLSSEGAQYSHRYTIKKI